ncbi:MAG: head decoration protein [Propionibacteriaceae bacterium]|nr:head decoration protein [Propionibacteriaceae bacterium]
MLDLSIKTTATPGTGDHRWLRTKDPSDWTVPVTVQAGLLQADVHYDANGVIPSGIPLGKITATGKHGPYDPDAEDGRAVLAGFLLDPARLSYDFKGQTTTEFAGALLVLGLIETALLPVAVELNTHTPTTGQFVFVDVDYVAPEAPAGTGE